MDWAMLGLMLGWIGIVAGAAWRFGKVEEGITELKTADAQLRVDIKKLDQRLTAEISEVRWRFATSGRKFATCGRTFAMCGRILATCGRLSNAFLSACPRRPTEPVAGK